MDIIIILLCIKSRIIRNSSLIYGISTMTTQNYSYCVSLGPKLGKKIFDPGN